VPRLIPTNQDQTVEVFPVLLYGVESSTLGNVVVPTNFENPMDGPYVTNLSVLERMGKEKE